MDTHKNAFSVLSRRAILAASVAGAGTLAFATPALAAGDLRAVPKLPGEVSRLATATSRTGKRRYEVIDVVVVGDRARLFVPHTTPPSRNTGTTMLWYYHARNGSHTALSSAFAYSADLAVDRGIVSICPTYGGSIWTSKRALEIQAAVAAWASSVWRIDASLLRSDSGGGPLLTWAYGTRMLPNILGAYLSNSSYDLEERAMSEPDKVLPHYADLAAVAAANPARLPPSVWRGARLRITGSSDDVVVPFAKHGMALRAAALPVAKEATIRIHAGEGTGGHTVPSFTNKEMLETFQRWLAEGPVPGPETPPTPLSGAGTYENGSDTIVTTGIWSTLHASADSGGSIAQSSSVGASATLTFTGTSVSWISRLTSSSGVNDVQLDGVTVATIDGYSATARSRQTVWSSGRLPAGPHTVTISRGGSRHPASTGSTLILDAFVVGEVTSPPATAVPTPIAEWSFTESRAPFASAIAGAPALRQGTGSAARRVTTPFGAGIDLNGSTDYLTVPRTELGPLNLGASTGAVTVAAWVLTSDSNSACLAGVWEESTVGALRSYALFNNLPQYGGWERVCMHVSKRGGPTPGYPFSRDYSVEPRRLSRGVWQLHVGTYDGAVAVSYLDGTATAYPSYTDALGATYAKNPYVYPDGLNAAPGDFVVGANGRDGVMINQYRGTLARVRVWDRALTAEQVRELYTLEKVTLS
ncbi:LamG-like jellyroll fold domain-containing protein [Rathayibacter iranicus]|uniref:LamG-like jellyroll fold domain-containing protein n=2 Tax=Rathayibacter iranicus TaxID=59737 RepID=A0AAD1ELL4_9MICO|nr:LamG-like jellyroll fold domain-containing protein [Rathayibacter iranicus]AZZ55227.1 hypothetical protein C7V51_04475 [Rathayibacter iranicus]MWV31531.1 hypothetical protein [Rathayibacter iranicus NCPPB 2253 = VKM Ac-1602]PPI49361.1 hypothetical protein C5E09_03545 [Rathayibacter iranicus]PPI61618.1 hypothetical protein C5E08_04460 [Rathayibacter iranicus]PPI72069.1 hypothetical protein C5E01_06170 [Rathayibacter iranicus]